MGETCELDKIPRKHKYLMANPAAKDAVSLQAGVYIYQEATGIAGATLFSILHLQHVFRLIGNLIKNE
jgi:hypothetical protein